MNIIQMSNAGLACGYLLLLIPLGIILWTRVRLAGTLAVAMLRMTVQLLFVGLYLQVVFDLNLWWLNVLWLLVMTLVADVSIVNGSGLRLSRFAVPVFAALFAGVLIPLLFFVLVIVKPPDWFDARYFIPIAGMIMGNCLRADIVGLRGFYKSLRDGEKPYSLSLAQGATHSEAIAPYMREALEASLAPTIATIATIGLVALPGMMTGVILGGADPMTAIKYQIAIMIAIFTGTAIGVFLAIRLTITASFTAYGVLRLEIFKA
jgi:putative ABC transport system permease protein